MTSCRSETEVKDSVKEYYGKVLQSSDDLQSTACQLPKAAIPKHVCKALSLVHQEVLNKYYGCGISVPQCLVGTNVVDLGSGSGRDCYAVSKLVGQDGSVTGVDMTDEQLEIANKYIDYHTEKFQYKQANVRFVKGNVEDLKQAGIADSSMDIAISNCVVNMCHDKRKVLQEVYRVLKFGGEFYFSDLYCDRRLDDSVKNHPILWNEGGGAFWWQDLNKMAVDIGFEQPRIYSAHHFELTNPQLKKLVGDAKFVSAVYRLFKVDKSNKTNEYKQVIYNGGIVGSEDKLKLGFKLEFETNQQVTIDNDTWNIINQSRFNKYFQSSDVKLNCANVQTSEFENPFEVSALG